jgi:oligoendopeptidase F
MRCVLFRVIGFLCTAALVTSAVPPANAVERSEIPEKYTWNLKDVFPGEAVWKAARANALKRIPEIARFKGSLSDSADALLRALTAVMDLDRDLARIRSYASWLRDQDTRVSRSQEMIQEADQAIVGFRTAAAFLRPEILSMDPAKVRGFVASEPRLKPYAFFLDDILRRKPHTLSPEEEKIVARAGNLEGAGEAIYSVLTNADFPYPEVTLSTGEKVRLDAAAYTKYRAAPDRSDRDKVFGAFWTRYHEFERTMGAALYAQVKSHVFDRDVHKFQGSLDDALFEYAIPTAVYRRLISDVHANLPTLHRYLELRKRVMGLGSLGYEDLYAPIVKEANATFTPEKAMDLTLVAFAPLGKEYVETLREGYTRRWVDFLPSTGKRSGAYSETAYGVHPYQLLNFMGSYDDVSTLAHESGHSMHSHFSDTSQPYVSHDYSTFVGEVASTLNENLLFRQMLREAKDDATRLFLLGSHLDLLRNTLFRQTLFAEFELTIHETAERGETLTGEGLSRLYLKLLREYYGHDRGVCEIKDLYGIEWAYIPHFYWNFYVYQYATSLTASISLSRGILDEASATGASRPRRDAYLLMLRSGSSKYPIDLLRDAGVDMTTSAPFAAAMEEMNQTMDEMEAILNRAGGK